MAKPSDSKEKTLAAAAQLFCRRGYHGTALQDILAASGAPRRVGLSTAREGATWFYTDIVPVASLDAIHAVDRYWLVAEALGVGDTPKRFHVPIDDAAHEWAVKTLHGLPRPWLVLGVGSRWLTKRWPPSHFAMLARRAQASFGGTSLFVGGGEEPS